MEHHSKVVGSGSILCTTMVTQWVVVLYCVLRRWFYTVDHHSKVVGSGFILWTTTVTRWAVVLYCVLPW